MTGATLKAFLDIKMINLSELARRMGLPKTSLPYYWTVNSVPMEIVTNIATQLGVTTEYIFKQCERLANGEDLMVLNEPDTTYGKDFNNEMMQTLIRSLDNNTAIGKELLTTLKSSSEKKAIKKK